jgi:sugar phosphate permease
VAAAVAVVAVAILSLYMPEEADLASDAERREGLRAVILFYSAVTFGTGVLTWFLLPESTGSTTSSRSNPLAGMAAVIRRPIVWAQAAVIVCAYCAYKGLDNYSLYAVQVLGMDEVEGAKFTAYAAYIRPVAAVAAGFIADRFSAAKTIGLTFLILTASYVVLAVAAPTPSWLPIIYANIFVSFFAVFGLRGVYFALLQETRTPAHLTGTTVGMVSFVGYTPEIFFASIAGRILDHAPGIKGHQDYFAFLAGIAIVGLLVVAWLMWLNRRQSRP